MPVFTECRCGKKLKFRDSFAGKVVPCPECDSDIRIPGARRKRPASRRRRPEEEFESDDDYAVDVESGEDAESAEEGWDDSSPDDAHYSNSESGEPNFDAAVEMMDDCDRVDAYDIENDGYDEGEDEEEYDEAAYEEEVAYKATRSKKQAPVDCPDCGEPTPFPASKCKRCKFEFNDGNCAGCGDKFAKPRKPKCKCKLKPVVPGVDGFDNLCANCGRNHKAVFSVRMKSTRPCPWCGADWLIQKITGRLNEVQTSQGLGYSNLLAKPKNMKKMSDEARIDAVREIVRRVETRTKSLRRDLQESGAGIGDALLGGALGGASAGAAFSAGDIMAASKSLGLDEWEQLLVDSRDRLTRLHQATDFKYYTFNDWYQRWWTLIYAIPLVILLLIGAIIAAN